jgi:hypothetical protein
MPLTAAQLIQLSTAIARYAFPRAYFDYTANAPVTGLTMPQVEARIRNDLLAGTVSQTKDGLSNVLYWGFAQMGGLAPIRVARFRSQVSQQQLQAASHLLRATPRPALYPFARLGLPQFSGVSFVSKVRMFLDPTGSAALDSQIMKIHSLRPTTVLAAVRTYKTRIPVSAANSAAYEAWCDRLDCIRTTYMPTVRVVDIERGLFHLIQAGHAYSAADLLADA